MQMHRIATLMLVLSGLSCGLGYAAPAEPTWTMTKNDKFCLSWDAHALACFVFDADMPAEYREKYANWSPVSAEGPRYFERAGKIDQLLIIQAVSPSGEREVFLFDYCGLGADKDNPMIINYALTELKAVGPLKSLPPRGEEI